MTGIYCIENTANGKRYIGQARHIERRWRQHRVSLENGKHCNDHLQRAWKKYGENAFSFYVLELCDLESLSDRERFYIAKFDTLRNGYNMTEGGDGTRGYEHTEDYKRQMSELYAGRTFSQDTLRKMSEVKRGVTPEMTQARLDGYKIVSQKDVRHGTRAKSSSPKPALFMGNTTQKIRKGESEMQTEESAGQKSSVKPCQSALFALKLARFILRSQARQKQSA